MLSVSEIGLAADDRRRIRELTHKRMGPQIIDGWEFSKAEWKICERFYSRVAPT